MPLGAGFVAASPPAEVRRHNMGFGPPHLAEQNCAVSPAPESLSRPATAAALAPPGNSILPDDLNV